MPREAPVINQTAEGDMGHVFDESVTTGLGRDKQQGERSMAHSARVYYETATTASQDFSTEGWTVYA